MGPRSVDGNKLSYVVYNDGCPYYSAPFERTTIMSFGGWVWRRHRCGTLMAYNGGYVLMVSPPTDMCLLTTSTGNQTDDTI